jgi:hypothetical protein
VGLVPAKKVILLPENNSLAPVNAAVAISNEIKIISTR